LFAESFGDVGADGFAGPANLIGKPALLIGWEF
jgi:hypothetical protein